VAPVVADSSALIALQRIGRLELLHGLFGEIAVPPAVAREVERGGLIEAVRPSLDALLADGFRLSPAVYSAILEAAGEDESR